MDGSAIGALSATGLGYNNLLYMAVVLEHLKLTVLLADFLATKTPGTNTPQTIVTTHSPTLAASAPPNRVHVLYFDQTNLKSNCNSLAKAGMDEKEQGELQRMMDLTRATLYFAKAAILVEGISEAMLVPVLAKRLGHDLAKLHISVVPICGVAFETFKKLLAPAALGIPVSIITDADPAITKGDTWKQDVPEADGDGFKLCARTAKLLTVFADHETVKVRHSKLTLEYDLAEAADNNAVHMALAWEGCFDGAPGTFNTTEVIAAGNDRSARAMAAWRGICRAHHTGSKANFAQHLAAMLAEKDINNQWVVEFEVPTYIEESITHVVTSCLSGPIHNKVNNKITSCLVVPIVEPIK
jgi:putative ATP-dependent endonuclease of the OLD family